MKTNATLSVRRSDERGHADHGWLNSRFSFSFGDYYDPAQMGFRSLRVINDDRVAPGGGFPTHGHRDMEIFSYVLEGELAHQDSMGNSRVLRPGQIQLMSAGSGVSHSEFNPSATETAHFLQIWVLPRQRGLDPRYTEWTPGAGQEHEAKVLVISADGRDGSATIAQDVDVWRVKLQPGTEITHHAQEGRGVWFHLVRGNAALNGIGINPGDAISSDDAGDIVIRATGQQPVEALLFDLL
ncbi:MAG: pirin family protein [Akkermansiaceae bacterium]|nr:pirin family protein [Akkermansiaceae bacterium]